MNLFDGFIILLAQCRLALKSTYLNKVALLGVSEKRGFNSGDVLLSHGLSPYYHRGCSVSLPCSEWGRVGPLRYCHQSAEPHWRFAAAAATQARGRISGYENPFFKELLIR